MSGLGIDEVDTIARHRVREIIDHKNKQFVEYIFNESNTTVNCEDRVIDGITESIAELHHRNFRVSEQDEQYAQPKVVLHPKQYHDLQDEVSTSRFAVSNPERPLEVRGAEVETDPTLPEDKGMVLHPNGLIPSHPSDIERPWLVRDGDAVVTLLFD